MNSAVVPSLRVILILDPHYGSLLRKKWPVTAVWITMSPANEAVVRSLWAAHPAEQYLVGLTGIAFREDVSPEMHLLSAIETIDLHHGLSSTEQPYTALEVIGVSLGTATRVALSDIGFEMFGENKAGFVATRAQPSSTTKIG